MRIVAADTIAPQPWRNGGGQTRELYAWPEPASGEDWTLRISLADIERDGPFSAFPGVQRSFAVIEGGGVALQFADGEQTLRVGDAPCVFDGAAAPGCRLLAGPTRDLNLMLRGVSGSMRLGLPAEGGWRALFCAAAARLQLADGDWLELPASCLLLDLPAGPMRLESAGPVYGISAELG